LNIRLTAIVLATCVLVAACGQKPSAPVAAGPQAAKAAAPKAPPPAPHAMPTEATTKSLAKDHSTIRYRVYGSGEPAIVLIHGWSCDSGYWDSQLDDLAVQHTVVTLDLAGHGKSDAKKRKNWSMANFGADVAAVVNAVGTPRVVLVGHSMGGPVALEAARLLPGKVIGIVGVDTFRDIAHPFPKEATNALLKSMREDFAKATTGLVDKNFFTDRTDPIIRKWIVKDMSSAPSKVAIPALESLVAMDYGPLLNELDLPIVVINADQPPTDEAATRRIEPRFRVVTVAGAGHFLMIEKPPQFNAMLGRILDAWAGLQNKPPVRLSDPAPTR